MRNEAVCVGCMEFVAPIIHAIIHSKNSKLATSIGL